MKTRLRALLNVLRGRPTIYRARIEHSGRVYLGRQPGLQVWDSTFPAHKSVATGPFPTAIAGEGVKLP